MYQQYLNQAQSSLNYMNSEELRDFLNDEDKLQEKVDEILKSLNSEKDKIINENRQLAENNLGKEPELIELKSKVNEMSTEGKELCQKVQEKLNQIKLKSSNTNPETILALLQTAAAESEEESEKIATQFLDNNSSVDEFMDKFMSSRKLMHLRKLKAEKMSELLRQQRSGNNPNNRIGAGVGNFGPPGNFYQPSQGSVPYPMNPGNLPMPMPGYRF